MIKAVLQTVNTLRLQPLIGNALNSLHVHVLYPTNSLKDFFIKTASHCKIFMITLNFTDEQTSQHCENFQFEANFVIYRV